MSALLVIKRTDQEGGYVAPGGSYKSYTKDIRKARLYLTKEEAEKDRCPVNEVVVPLDGEFKGGQGWQQ